MSLFPSLLFIIVSINGCVPARRVTPVFLTLCFIFLIHTSAEELEVISAFVRLNICTVCFMKEMIQHMTFKAFCVANKSPIHKLVKLSE